MIVYFFYGVFEYFVLFNEFFVYVFLGCINIVIYKNYFWFLFFNIFDGYFFFEKSMFLLISF